MRTLYSAEIVTRQDKGNAKEQQDVLHVYNNQCIFLADGLSTAPYGRQAAEFIVEAAESYYKLLAVKERSWKLKSLVVQRMMRSLNRSLCKQKSRLTRVNGMNTVLTMLFQFNNKMGIFHLGDSAVYLLRGQQVHRLTPVHRDSITGARTQWLGNDHCSTPFSSTLFWQEGDLFLLCSDGVADWLTDADILEGAALEADQACVFYLQRAADYGSNENKSVALLRCKKSTAQQIVWI